MNSRSASFCVGLMGTTRCGWMPSVASTLLVLSQRSCTPLITYACTLCTCARPHALWLSTVQALLTLTTRRTAGKQRQVLETVVTERPP